MSKVKSAPEKKRQSLLKDRRNIYGECPTSSRKNIARGKQRSRMGLRRAVAEELRSMKGASTDFDADAVEGRARERVVESKRSSFKKLPDAPLAVVLDRKLRKRVTQREGSTKAGDWAHFLEQLRSEKHLLRGIKRKSK